mgnify:FL=1
MYDVVLVLLPALAVSIMFFGWGAIKVTLISVLSCMAFEWLIQKFIIRGNTTVTDGSALVTGILLAFNVPSNLPWWIIVIGSLVAIGIAKMSFGGLGKNPFNPALVGRVFLLISFPAQMTSWPKVKMLDFTFTNAETGATPLSMLSEGISNGESVSSVMERIPYTYMDLLTGSLTGSLGEVSAIALLIGGIYLLIRKVITWHIPVSIILTFAAFTGILHLANPERFIDPLFHLLTGGLMLGAVYMATDMVTSPMTRWGMVVFGIGIGIITVIIRSFGAYPEGISFAILIMNGFVPLLNKWFKPKHFGEKIKS